eukprot:356699-Chlamydomonas_euryale.AAC.6
MQARMSGSPLAGGGGAASGDVDSRLREMELRHQEQALSLRKLEEHVLMLQNQVGAGIAGCACAGTTTRMRAGGRFEGDGALGPLKVQPNRRGEEQESLHVQAATQRAQGICTQGMALGSQGMALGSQGALNIQRSSSLSLTALNMQRPGSFLFQP